MAPVEICNGLDEDCDLVSDNGFLADEQYTTFTSLSSYDAVCDGTTQRFGINCYNAIKGFCGAGACNNTGFGPTENSGDVAEVICTITTIYDLTWADLESQHPACDGVTESFGPSCAAAVHRYCSSVGLVSGYGPVELIGANPSIACAGAEAFTLYMTTYSELVTYHSGCDGSTQRFGLDCNAAISHYCSYLGHVSGFGPVENSDDSAWVVCVDS